MVTKQSEGRICYGKPYRCFFKSKNKESKAFHVLCTHYFQIYIA